MTIVTSAVRMCLDFRRKRSTKSCIQIVLQPNDLCRMEWTARSLFLQIVMDEDVESEIDEAYEDSSDPDYVNENQPHLLNQSELNDLIRDLDLTKEKSELLASRLKQWKLLTNETKVTVYRKRHELFSKYFEKNDSICFCKDIDGLMEALGFSHIVEEWRLFIDGSTDSLKAVLLHNGNEKPSIPVGHAVDMKESRESLQNILTAIKYDKYQWSICADLKVTGLLMEMWIHEVYVFPVPLGHSSQRQTL